MGWLSLLGAVLGLAKALAEYAQQRQLLQAGAAEAMLAGLQNVQAELDKARRASDAVTDPKSAADSDFAKRVSDEFKRPDGT